MTTYEGGNTQGPPGRHPAGGARTGAAPRLRDHGGAAGTQRRPGRPADRHGISGPAPPGAGGPGGSELVGRRRRVYRLTPAGRRALDTERITWRDFSAAVTTLLEPAPLAVTSP